ncbi:MAG: SCO family protein [Opitutaceae bacterium]|nr:SCO family protein [Verrucomicrobiales bacterium]
MRPLNKKIAWTVWGGLLLVVAGVAATFFRSLDLTPPLPVLGYVSNFTLTNQLGAVINSTTMQGQVWVADVIFTRCPLQCVRLTKQLAALQADLPPGKPVQLVSLTVDPDFDTPAVLQKYGERYGAVPGTWQFLTGPKPEIHRLSVEDLKFVVADKAKDERDTPDDLFIHSTRFVLIDKQGRVRAYYDGEAPATRTEVLKAIGKLLHER